MQKTCSRCKIKKSIEEFYFYNFNNKFGIYCKSCQKIKNALRIYKHNFICDIHGEVYQTKTLKHCKKCNEINKFYKKIEELKLRNINFDGFVDLKESTNHTKKVKAKCKIHGIYISNLNQIFRSKGTGCRKCGDLIAGKTRTKFNLKERKCLKCKKIKKANCFIKRLDKNNRPYLYSYCKDCDIRFTGGNHKKRCEQYGTKYLRFNKIKLVYQRDNYICQYCGIKCINDKKKYLQYNYVTIDCIIPISKGGNYEPNNCVTSCRRCNLKKSNKLINLKSMQNGIFKHRN